MPGRVGFVLPAKETSTQQLYARAWVLWVPRTPLSITWGLEELEPRGWLPC